MDYCRVTRISIDAASVGASTTSMEASIKAFTTSSEGSMELPQKLVVEAFMEVSSRMKFHARFQPWNLPRKPSKLAHGSLTTSMEALTTPIHGNASH